MMRATSVSAAIVMVLAGCAVQQDWPPTDAFRTIARTVAADEEGRRVAVPDALAGGRDELPWGVRQALTTAGFDVVPHDSPHDPERVQLRFREFGRSERGDWLIVTEVYRDAATTARVERWTVECPEQQCSVASRLLEAGDPAVTPP